MPLLRGQNQTSSLTLSVIFRPLSYTSPAKLSKSLQLRAPIPFLFLRTFGTLLISFSLGQTRILQEISEVGFASLTEQIAPCKNV
jgi:hypothetical protein